MIAQQLAGISTSMDALAYRHPNLKASDPQLAELLNFRLWDISAVLAAKASRQPSPEADTPFIEGGLSVGIIRIRYPLAIDSA